MTKCTVIIPYYQREPGILGRALRSVFAQTHADFDVIVVDDTSPLPAETELREFQLEERARITVIKQPNAGPGGARNMGLDHVPADSACVAFLDSDDEWAPKHLGTAVAALSLFDADCYWASIGGGEEFYYHFGVADLAGAAQMTRLSDDPPIVEIADLAGTMLKNWSFLHLSCMVLGQTLARNIRFDAALRLAAEDVLFFYDCVRNARRCVLCESIGATRGEGINIFHGMDSDSPQFLRQQFNTWVALDHLENRFVHRPEDRASIEVYKQTARNQALWGQARLVKTRKAPQLKQLAQWAWRDPKILRSALALAVGKIAR
ncbi:glycosyltransferase family 2 protein [Aquamicrobium terrae]